MLKGRQAAAKRIEQEYERAGEYNAYGGEGHCRKISQSDFCGNEIDGPDGGEKDHGEPDEGVAGHSARGGDYAHGREPLEFRGRG